MDEKIINELYILVENACKLKSNIFGYGIWTRHIKPMVPAGTTIVAIGTIAGIHLQILREEKFLLNKFGEKYTEYKKQTRRYL